MWENYLPLRICLVFAGLLLPRSCEALYRCDGTPEVQISPRSTSENQFMLKISGNPHMYVPGEKYAVGIQGTKQIQGPEKFVGFALKIEPSSPSGPQDIESLGTFQLYGDALTKFSEKCAGMVMQASNAPRSEVNVHWTAPPPGSGCLTFRATVVENKEHWYMHDGLLSRTLCEDVQENFDEQPENLEKCCACDEAKYEVTFEGLWSRHTHPKDFPPDGWRTRFSDVIGASHTMDYRFWEYGGIASEGLREVAERGWTRMLESELKAESENIRTIIKARGISYPNVTGKTFAVFRVDKQHHLMSLVSMIVPSPDWIVGVSGLELCLRNCSWVDFKVLNLKPWDVGTDSGVTYTSPDSPTTPREPIRRITNKYPADASNPFYDTSGEEMKPLARLYLTRQRLYEKSCSDDSIGNDDEDPHSDCAVGDWREWSQCSVTCGRGHRYKQRFYTNEDRATSAHCNRELTAREPCQAPRRCSGEHPIWPLDPNAAPPYLNEPPCLLSEWEEWSSCSATCGNAVKTRSRHYLHGAQKRCGVRRNPPELQQTVPCEVDECEGDQPPSDDELCGKVVWSDWTACSATCGSGIKTRSTFNIPRPGEECSAETRTEQVECPAIVASCDFSPDSSPDKCLEEVDEGECNNKAERWYFDSGAVTCKGFLYRGCKGNGNNFLSKEECTETCSGHVDPLQAKPEFNGISPGSMIFETTVNPIAEEDPEEEKKEGSVDCKVSRWSRWSACTVTCGRGTKTKTRHIKAHPVNGGKHCPSRLVRTKPCGKTSCDTSVGSQQGGDQEDSGESPPEQEEEAPMAAAADCVMGRWSPWSPCSATCGIMSSQMRTRNIITPSPTGQSCGDRVETRSCNLLPCKV